MSMHSLFGWEQATRLRHCSYGQHDWSSLSRGRHGPVYRRGTSKEFWLGAWYPNDLRNDVWWLDARHHQRPVEARPGDRVVLTLDEIPSSGFSWRFINIPEGIRVLTDSSEDWWEPELSSSEDDLPEDLAGGVHARSFLIEIERSAERGAHRLAAVKDQPWDPGKPSDSFELLVSVNPPLHGLQVPEREFALTA
jgi:hypothetical protein